MALSPMKIGEGPNREITTGRGETPERAGGELRLPLSVFAPALARKRLVPSSRAEDGVSRLLVVEEGSNNGEAEDAQGFFSGSVLR